MRFALPAAAGLTLALAGCAAPSASVPTVVATTTVLGDIAGRITDCAGGTVEVLMPAGADPHDFAPSSRQVADLIDAQLVVANGLGLEAGLTDALATAEQDGAHVLEVAPIVDPLPFEGGDGTLDPHVWFDMTRMATAAERIGAELTARTGDAAYTTCAQAEAEEIRAADAGVRALLSSVPEADRVLVTDHDALGYFASAYGFRIAGTVVPGGTTLAEPSSADLAALADQLRAEGTTVIFSNVAQPSALADAVAAEAGSDVRVVPLYVESLGAPGTAADTYPGMMRANAQAIVAALTGGS